MNELHPLEMIDISGKPMIEIVALRDIKPNEEIFIDYGQGWEEAWSKHVESWNPTEEHQEYISAEDYLKNGAYTVRTTEEQKENPYPSNLQLVCIFPGRKGETDCRLPCDIDERIDDDGESHYDVSYKLKVHNTTAKRMIAWDICAIGRDELYADSISAEDITLIDKWATKDQHLDFAFRHEIGVPEKFSPSLWMEPAIYEASPPPPLRPGEHVAITWKHNGKPITRNALYVGLPPNFNAHMYDFAERMGVMEIFRNVLNGRPNTIGSHRYVDLKEGQYYVQRPHWNSNMHWVIPNDEVGTKELFEGSWSWGLRYCLGFHWNQLRYGAAHVLP
jgi:hypothetical protein